MALLEIRGLRFAYDRREVLKGIGLALGEGSVMCVAGPNGCGKTTLLDCVLGQARPSAGEILVNGRSPASWGARRLATQLAFVPQVHERTFPYTVFQIVLMGRAAKVGFSSSPSSGDEDAARRAIARVGLSGLEDRPYTRLSGGECQLVMLARALAQEASLLLMDEPTAHLDLRNEMVFLGIASSLAREESVSILMATHDPGHAFHFENAGIPTRVALMRGGVLAFEGSPSATLTEGNVRSVYGVLAKVVALDEETAATTRHLLPVGLADGEAPR